MRQAFSDGGAVQTRFEDDDAELRRAARAIKNGTIAETRRQMADEENEKRNHEQ